MKRSLKLFNKKGQKPRRRENISDYDEEYDDEGYSRDDEYDEDDYPDEEFEEQYGDEIEDDRYEDDGDYPDDEEESYEDDRDYRDEDDYPEDEERYRGDRDYRRDRERYEDEEDDRYPGEENERYESDRDYRDEEEDDVDHRDDEDDRYEDEVAYSGGEDGRYEDDVDYRDDEDSEYEDEYGEDYDPEYDDERDEDYDPEYDEDYRDDEYDDGYEDDYRDDRRTGRAHRDDDRKERGRSRNKKSAGKENKESAGARIINFIKETSFAERAAAIVAVILLVGGIFTMNFYSKALSRTKEISSFVEVGTNLQVSDVVGSTGLLAVADAERAKAIAAHLIEEEEEEETVADDAKGVTIQMTLTTIKSDMKIKFINSQSTKLVAGVPFTVTVVTPDGTSVSYDDHDKDGIIYKKDMTAGTYKVTPNALSSEYSNYTLDTSTKSLTIKDTVEMKAVDVSNEIKKESQVNAAVEDTAVQTVVESELKDTVEWVQSNQDSLSSGDGKYIYEEVDRSNIESIITSKIYVNDVRYLAMSREPATDGSSLEASTETSKDSGSTDNSSEDASKDSGSTDSSSDSSSKDSGSTDGASTDASKEEQKQEDKTMTLRDLSLKVGETGSLIVDGPSSASFSKDVKEGDSNFIEIGDKGTIIAKSAGKATVTVTADGYKSATATVVVTETEKKTMELSATSVTVGINKSVTIKGAPSGATFKPHDDSVNKVSAKDDGTITGLSEGNATVIVKADGYKDAYIQVTVTKLKTITLESTSLKVALGEKKNIVIKDPDPSSVKFKFKSDEEILATVDENGVVTGKSIGGPLRIDVSAEGYETETVTVTVTATNTEGLAFKASKVSILQGRTYKLELKDSTLKPAYSSKNTDIATVESDGTVKGIAVGSTKIVAKCDGYDDAEIEINVLSSSTVLKDKDGNTLYVKNSEGKYVEATYADYFDNLTLYLRKENTSDITRKGWWTIDGKTYYYDKNGNKVTGDQVIQGAKYSFGSDGALSSGSGTLGIDVSKWNGNIEWNKVKSSGVNYVIVRCGYRGSSAGALIEDPKYKSNIQGAIAAGLKVGIYFFSQAVNEVEAVEEASMCVNLAKGYNLSFPIYIDVEASNGRGDSISTSQRTANIKAFCGTIQSAGYRAGVYSNKTWFTQNINTSSLTSYNIWLAQYAAAVTYSATKYDMWQYTSKGSVAGISGKVDMNILYR